MGQWNTVAIIGVGLIGGSVGLTLRRRGLADRVIGIGRRQSSLQRARECKAVSQTTSDLESGVAEAELVVVCTPVTSIVEHVQRAAQACPPGAVLTDAGSTKASAATPWPVAKKRGRMQRETIFSRIASW
jgi:prephenate dehydrogenase